LQINQLATVGGDDYRRMTTNVMTSLFTKSVSLLYSLHGRKGKKPLVQLTIYKCILGEIYA